MERSLQIGATTQCCSIHSTDANRDQVVSHLRTPRMGRRPVARYRVGKQTRRRILDATRDLLVEVGLDGTTLKAITDRAEVGAGSFYNLFDSKEDAVLEVVRSAIAAVDPDPEARGADTLGTLVEAFIRFVEDDPALARIYVTIAVSRGMVDEKVRERVLAHHVARVQRFADALRRQDPACAEEDVTQRAEATVATLTGFTVRAMIDPAFDFARHARRLLDPVGTTS